MNPRLLPHWPRGKYNGQRIIGIDVRFRIRVDRWYWRPKYYKYVYGLAWGCFILNWGWTYE